MTVKQYLACAVALSAVLSCTTEPFEPGKSGNIDRELPPSVVSPEAPEGFDESIFDVLNLDYPGLEKVKSSYEAGNLGNAASELLEYWRSRSNVVNPYVDLVSPSFTDVEKNKADQALDYRFCVAKFVENANVSSTEADDVYYSFAKVEDKQTVIDWDFVPAGVTDQEFRYQKHRHQWMEPQAKVYRATGDEKYFLNWQTVYLSWLEKYVPSFPGDTHKYPEPGGTENDVDYWWKGLQVAERVLSQINILPYYINSKNFTPQWLSFFLTMFSHQVELMRNNLYPDGNIRVTQLQALATAGILMPEFRNAEEWTSQAYNLINQEVDAQFFSDGVLVECDPSYHIAAISDFLEAQTVAFYNHRMDLLDEDYVTKLHNAMTFVADITYPDYSIDNWNDTRASSYSKSVLQRNFTKYSETFPEDQYLKAMATGGKQGAYPQNTIASYPDGGFYMMRNGYDANSTMIVLSNNENPKEAWHCQPDNNTFSFWNKGRNFLPDAGSYSYNTGSSRTNFAKASNHNTVTYGSNEYPFYKPQEVSVPICKSQSKDDLIVSLHKIYSGDSEEKDVWHRRAMFFVKREFLVVVDDIYGGLENMVNFHIHLTNDDDADVTTVPEDCAAYTNFADGNNVYIRTFLEKPSDGQFSEVTSSVSNKLDVISGSRKGYKIKTGKDTGGAARMITVICPFSTKLPVVSAKFTDNSEGISAIHPEGSAVRVDIDGESFPMSYSLNE